MNLGFNSDRQSGILDTVLLRSCRLGQFGVSRGFGFTQLMGSSAIGQIFLVDPQKVESDNIGQSAFECDDIGQLKVEAVKRRLLRSNPVLRIETYACVFQDVESLEQIVADADLLKIGVDDLEAQFSAADLAQKVGTDAVVAGTTGDNSQWFVAAVLPEGPPLQELLPEAWRGFQSGYKPPAFFPSCRLNAESLNTQAARLALGLLHHRAGSTLPIAEIGAALVEAPLVIGSNGWHEPSGFLTPARFLRASPAAPPAG